MIKTPHKSTVPTEEQNDALLIHETSKNQFIDNTEKTPMPCATKQIQIRNYHGIIETGITLPVDARWIFLTGENAFGKTAVLRAITIGLFGQRDQDWILLDKGEGEYQIALEVFYNQKSHIHIVGNPTVKPQRFTYFAAYGSSRLEIQSDRTVGEITRRSAKTYSLFNSDGVSLNIDRELILWHLSNDPRYEIVKEILLTLLPHGADIQIDREKMEVLYIEKESTENGGSFFTPIPFFKLASGNKSIIATVGDLIIRFYKEYENDGKKNIHPRDFEGIVIIDELDLHLHPKWLRRLPALLSETFPKIQFIAATHSEIAILGAPKNSVFLKVSRNQKEGIRLERLHIDIKNLLPQHILTSELFDLEEGIYAEVNTNEGEVRTAESTFSEIKEMDQITERLKEFELSDGDYPGNIFDKK